MKKPELLAPAGTLEKLKFAVQYGADAVYIAGKQYGLRAFAGNFSKEEMAEGVAFAHSRGVKVYVTVNIFAHNEDFVEMEAYLQELLQLQVDAILVSDPGILRLAREKVPELPIHISTQANTTNWSAVQFWKELGAERVVLARELSLLEIKEIKEKANPRKWICVEAENTYVVSKGDLVVLIMSNELAPKIKENFEKLS